jgi:hypothetical protein
MEKLSTRYRNAAMRIADDTNRFACCAIAEVDDAILPDSVAVDIFASIFAPSDNPSTFWGNGWERDLPEGVGEYAPFSNTPEGRDCRILALLLMAEIAEGAGL